MTEKEKMLAGLPFDMDDPEIEADRSAAGDLCMELNNTRPSDLNTRNEILKRLLPSLKERFHILSPFHVELGYNVIFGDSPLINYGQTIIDYAPVTIGDNAFIGPRACFNTLVDDLTPEMKDGSKPFALPITIGKNVWFGSEVKVCAGVTIGSGCVIGAGSVVTTDIPDNCLAAGDPARVIRSLEPDSLIGR